MGQPVPEHTEYVYIPGVKRVMGNTCEQCPVGEIFPESYKCPFELYESFIWILINVTIEELKEWIFFLVKTVKTIVWCREV